MDSRRLDKIRDAVISGDDRDLTEKDKQVKAELEITFRLLVSGKSRREVVARLVRDHGVRNEVTAYDRIRSAGTVFGDTVQASRAMEAIVAYQRAENVYEKAKLLMDTARDASTQMFAMDRMNKANELMIRIRGVDREEVPVIDPAKMEPSEYRLMLSGPVKGWLLHLMKMGRINLSELLKDVPLAEVVPPKELPDSDPEE